MAKPTTLLTFAKKAKAAAQRIVDINDDDWLERRARNDEDPEFPHDDNELDEGAPWFGRLDDDDIPF